jgi:hypothetical protein
MKIRIHSNYFFTLWLIFGSGCLILPACSGESPKKTDTQVMIKDTPENQIMLDAFSKQANRFEFNGCEFKYKGANFKLGSDLNKLKRIFSDSLLKKTVGTPTSPTTTLYYTEDKVFLSYEKEYSGVLDSFVIIFKNIRARDQYILINGAPLDKTMTIKEFVDNSKYEFSDFSMTNHAYYISFDHCDRTIEYELTLDVPLTYSGGGHLMFKDGGVNLENTKPVESLYISYID